MKQSNDKYICVPFKPGWIKPKEQSQTLANILIFYLVNTPVKEISSSQKTLSDYGWKKDDWKNSSFKSILKNSSDIIISRNTTYLEFKRSCIDLFKLTKGFHRKRNKEIAIIYVKKDPVILSLFKHIRNSLAHGRFQIFDDCFVFEDVERKRTNDFCLTARGIIKIKTLLAWKELIEIGPLDI